MLLAAATAGTAALAAPPDDARSAAERFVNALVTEDAATTCSLFSARIVKLLGGPEECAKVSEDSPGDSESEDFPFGAGEDEDVDDYIAQRVLDAVFRDARAIGLARGGYVTKQAGLTRLVNELRTLEPGLSFSIGQGAQAARAKKFTHVVVGRQTGLRALVLYAESDTGTIWRLSANGFTRSKTAPAGKGIPAKPARPATPATPKAPEQPPTFAITGVALVDDVSAYVTVTTQYEGTTFPFVLSMKLEDGAWKVDDIMVGLFSLLEAVFPPTEPK
jgi:hypothetical protein